MFLLVHCSGCVRVLEMEESPDVWMELSWQRLQKTTLIHVLHKEYPFMVSHGHWATYACLGIRSLFFGEYGVLLFNWINLG